MKKTVRTILCSILCASLLSACSSASSSPSPESTAASSASSNPESADVNASLTVVSTWKTGSSHYTQYSLTVNSRSTQEISDWKIHLNAEGQTADSHWNCEITAEDSVWTLTPADYNHVIKANQSLSEIGIIAYTSADVRVAVVSSDFTYADGTSVSVKADQPLKTAAPVSTAPAVTAETVTGKAAGQLHVDGIHLENSNNEVVQLKGVSTHGLAWYPQYVNEDAFRTLRDDWHANVVRLAMYTAESGGYCSGGNQEQLKELIDTGVKEAADLGMYVIIDWHILSDSSPMQNQVQAESFFDEMSKKYADYDNVLYEICNEPQNSPWSSVIKPYAEDIIPIIRANSPKAVIIVGTNTWSQDVDEVVSDPLSFDNVMYALHFYAGTHKEALRSKLGTALQAGIPVFVSECSICDASGNGGIDYDSAQAWLNLLNTQQVSFIAWSLSNKAETSALISSFCDKTSGWTEDDLSETGKWFMHAFKGN